MAENIEWHCELLDPMIRIVYGWRSLASEKSHLLAREYVDKRVLWDNISRALERYHRENREAIDHWPPEIASKSPKTKDISILSQYAGGDVAMYLDDSEFYNYGFYSMNGLVTDPVLSHLQYRKRLSWTAAERQTFLDKYRLHRREFKKIAAGLPHKSVKDVIEYYYVHRIDLNLKEVEQQSKKRGRKKVFTEGAVRK
jgi:hypothetical protein